MPTDRLDQSPAFYADLLESREILGRVVDTEFAAALHGGAGPLTQATTKFRISRRNSE